MAQLPIGFSFQYYTFQVELLLNSISEGWILTNWIDLIYKFNLHEVSCKGMLQVRFVKNKFYVAWPLYLVLLQPWN